MGNLHIHPRKTVSFPEFVAQTASYSIALDGYVSGGPVSDIKTCHFNFNHHEDVNRLATRSTAGQVFMALKMGFMEAVPPYDVSIYVNDCDQDVCLSVWMLQNWVRVVNGEPLLNRLTWISDVMDTCAGAYPVNSSSVLMRELAWIYEPYTRVRELVGKMSDGDMRHVIDAVSSRISLYLIGKGETIRADSKFDVVFFNCPGRYSWEMVKEQGPYSRTAMRDSGIRAFVSIKSEDPANQKWRYSIGLLSPFSMFPIKRMYKALQFAEYGENWRSLYLSSGWGGSDIIGGGPRDGSTLSPDKVREVINQVLEKEFIK